MLQDDPLSGLYTDRYQLAMAYAYWSEGRAEEPATFDAFFRKLPFEGGYAVFAGLATLLELLDGFRFSQKDLEFLEGEGFPSDFLSHLEDFRFRGSIWAPPEGEVIFPLEPIVRVEGGLLEAQLLETLLLNVLNFQSLVATKACRCRHAAGQRVLSEFGLRRAQGLAGRWASRAAVVGGFDSTSNLDAARRYQLPSAGTMAHSFIQSHDSELEAFRSFACIHASDTILLLDTYDTLRSGLPKAIEVAKELADKGQSLKGVRLDSGDLAYLARKVRERLDAEGLEKVSIVASNQIDERVLRSLNEQGAPIDVFGIGTSLATAAPDGALDGVYKLAHASGAPRLKTSDSLSKATLPGRKRVSRYRDSNGLFAADAIHLEEEDTPNFMIHPSEPSRTLALDPATAEPLLQEVFRDGKITKEIASVADAAAYLRERLKLLPAEHKRIENPHTYKVGISQCLYDLRQQLIEKFKVKD